MKRPAKGGRAALTGPSQRQLRAGELIRHALVELLREDPLQDLAGIAVTVSEARMSSDLRHAFVFVERLGGEGSAEVVDLLNRHAKYLRGQLGRRIVMKFTPDLVFRHDETFEAAERMNRLFADPRIQHDLEPREEDKGGDGDSGS